jgi:phosphate/sulfate permease
MTEYYLLFVILLFILAISDLIVGVSNDAVNFLNSAVGSKVASFKTILLIASIGIFLGATFSSGMMEIARKGIFNPQFYMFSDVMIIFLAVMMTDIFLLDLFNTFGLPTSTTVSLIFELLGASVAVALLKIAASGDSFSTLGQYINSESAFAIVSSILTSVAVAFVVGSAVQYFSRLLFTFRYQRRMKWVGGIWSGLALTFLTHFLLFKGIKGASFVTDGFVSWVGENTRMLLLGTFVFWSILMQVLVSVFKINVLRFIVLFGTFSLAMAFAGNDLVNFIGVPIAGFESFKIWTASGSAAESLSMEALSAPVRTDTYLLVLAGLIMIATLWFSSKARSVTETEVSLGRQGEGTENFSPNLLARSIVRYARLAADGMKAIVPNRLLGKAEDSFQMIALSKENGNPGEAPSFDLVRASVNLTVASLLIAFATSLKLPLSTTYVSFMVAMGTSLADRAWGRDSAVYRVAGVLNVIGGWFVTAMIAFTVSGICALLIFKFGMYAVGGLITLLLFFVIRSFAFHRKKEKSKESLRSFERQSAVILPPQLKKDTTKRIAAHLRLIATIYPDAIEGLLKEDRTLIQQAKREMVKLKEENESLKHKLYRAIKRIDSSHSAAARLYLLVYDLEQDILQSTDFIVKACRNYVENSLSPLDEKQARQLKKLAGEVRDYLNLIAEKMVKDGPDAVAQVLERKQDLFFLIEEQLSHQIEGIQQNGYGMRNSMLVFSLKLETKDLVAVAARFVKLFQRAEEKEAALLTKKKHPGAPVS